MKLAIALLTVFMLAGCAAFDPEPYKLERSFSKISLVIDPTFGQSFAGNTAGAMGQAVVRGDTCYITLRSYPICLAHEVRHCFEGDWHPKGFGNSDDCY